MSDPAAPGAAGQGSAAVLAGAAPVAVSAAPPAGGAQASVIAPGAGAAAPGAAPAAAAAAPAFSWLPSADEATVGYLQNKGWKEPTDILNAYRGAEKFISAPIEQRVVVPGPDAKPEEMAAFYNRLGRPADPAGYKLAVPEGAPKEFSTAAAAKMHELGITQKQGEALGAWWNEQANSTQASMKQQTQANFDADAAALKTEWGVAFQQNVVQAQTAARSLGLDAVALDKLDLALGHKGVMSLLQKIGSKTSLGEADFVGGNGSQPFGHALSPAQAKDRIQELTRDKAFGARYIAHDAAAVAEMKQLHEFAYPTEGA
jgi:hypothetical protein